MTSPNRTFPLPLFKGFCTPSPAFQPIMNTTWNVAGTATSPDASGGASELEEGGGGMPCRAASDRGGETHRQTQSGTTKR